MSIILDALRKAQQDRTKGINKAPPGTGGMLRPSDKSPRPPLRSILMAACCLMILSASIVYYFVNMRGQNPEGSLRPIAALPALPGGWSLKDNEELRERALRLYNDQNFKESAMNWEKLSKIEPQDAEVFNNLGLALKKSDDRDGALTAYDRALEINPDLPQALNNRAILYMENAHWDEAYGLLERAIKVQPDYAEPHLHLALIMEKKGRVQEALQHFKNFLEFNPESPDKLKRQIELRMVLLQSSLR